VRPPVAATASGVLKKRAVKTAGKVPDAPSGNSRKGGLRGADHLRPPLGSREINLLDASKLSRVTPYPRSAAVALRRRGLGRWRVRRPSRRAIVAALPPGRGRRRRFGGFRPTRACKPEQWQSAQASGRGFALIDVVDDVVVRDLGRSRVRLALSGRCPHHPEAAPSSGPYWAQIAGAIR
jgi:hypothetical protein